MNQSQFGLAIAVLLFVLMLVMLELGRRSGCRRRAKDLEGADAGLGVIDGALFGLLGLIIAFTFSGASARFDARRTQIVEEANAIGTAYLRLEMLPRDAQPGLRQQFRDYLDSRLRTYDVLTDVAAAHAERTRSLEMQGRIWTSAIAACLDAPQSASMLLLPALNQMFDIVTTRTMATRMHPPMIVFVLLAALNLIGAVLAGYGMSGGRSRSLLHMFSFALIMSATVYVIFDLEYPRVGLFTIADFDQAMRDVRASMK